MRKCLALLVLIVGAHLAAAPATLAGNDENLSDSGNAFVRTCSGIDNTSKVSDLQQMALGECSAYVMGLTEGILLEKSYAEADAHAGGAKVSVPYCVQDTYEVEQGQKVRILLKYIRSNPEKAHMITAGLFISAMGDAFPPCPQRK